MTDTIPLFEIAWDRREVQNAVESITRGSYWAKGPFVSAFESELEEFFGVERAVTVNSGTTALVAALVANEIGPGDEVIVPSFTFIATANAVRLVGAKPVFVDIERETLGLDPATVTEAITDETAAILPVHCYGSACRIDDLSAVARENDLTVIEDAAEAMGSERDGRPVGTFGDATALSFCQNKVVATGEGGAVLTDDADVARRLELYRSHGRASSDYFDASDSGSYTALGTNIRMSDLVASIGCAQMAKVDELVEKRRRVARRLHDGLADVAGVTPFRGSADSTHVYQLYTVLLDAGVDRAALVQSLDNHGVASKVYWDPPVHRTETYDEGSEARRGELPVTEDVSARALSLPMFPGLSASDTDRIVDAVAEGMAR